MKNLLRLFTLLGIVAFVACDDNSGVRVKDEPTEEITLVEESILNEWRQGYEGLGVDWYYVGLCDTYIDEFGGTYLPDNTDGTLIWCAFYGNPTANATSPTLPDGTYTFNGNDKVAGNLDSYYTYIVRRKKDSTPEQIVPTAAKVVVESGENGNIISYEYTLSDGEIIRARYEGDIHLSIGTPLTAPTPWIEEDYRTDFVGIYANLTGASAYTQDADILGVQLYDEPLDEQGRQTGGIVVQLELTTPELQGPAPMIPDGTYNVSMGTELYSTPVGDVLNLGGEFGHTMIGTTARLMDAEGNYLYGAVLSGSVTVATEGEQQTITVDLTTGTGVNINGTYTGAVTINNYTYTPPVSNDPFSTLTEDKELVATDGWIFTADYYTSYYHNRPDVSFIRLRGYSADPNDFFNIPMEGFEGFRFDLIVENIGTLTSIPSGTYTPDADGEHYPKTFELGARESADGGMRYTGSYGWMGYDWLGFIDPSRMAPLLDGSLVIVDYGNNEYGIQYNVLDDKGNSITFSHRTTVTFKTAQ